MQGGHTGVGFSNLPVTAPLLEMLKCAIPFIVGVSSRIVINIKSRGHRSLSILDKFADLGVKC